MRNNKLIDARMDIYRNNIIVAKNVSIHAVNFIRCAMVALETYRDAHYGDLKYEIDTIKGKLKNKRGTDELPLRAKWGELSFIIAIDKR